MSILFSLITTSAFAAVVKGYDAEKSCDLYRVPSTDSNGKIIINAGEVVISTREAYGLSFRDMEVNFDTREVLVQPTINIILGFNRPLIEGKGIIAEDNADFKYLINQLNRNLLLFDKMCIAGNKIIYAKMRSDEPTPVPTPTK